MGDSVREALSLARISSVPKMARPFLGDNSKRRPECDQECSGSASILLEGNPCVRTCGQSNFGALQERDK